MPHAIDVTWNGLDLTLDAERAAYAPGERALLLADLHLGKAATFRAHARPVPESVTHADLDRLSRLVDRYRPDRLIILGDMFHAREAHAPATLGAIRAWRERHALPLTLVRGNHDRRAGDPSPDLEVDVVDPPVTLGPCALAHEPPVDPTRPTLAGHVHPGISPRQPGRRRAPVRASCFWLTDDVIVFPAFSVFTGIEPVDPAPNDRIFAVGEGSIVEVRPTPRTHARAT